MVLWKVFWEYPLTASFSTFIFFFYFIVVLFVPEPLIVKYFFARPGEFNPLNWLLSIFFHGSPGHLLSNLIFLLVLGRVVEEKMGALRWLLFFFMAGFISVIADGIIRAYFFRDFSPVVGTSGAIAGLIAVASLMSPLHIHIRKRAIPFPVFASLWMMAYSDVQGVFRDDRIAHWAHLAGYISVFFTAYLLTPNEREQLKNGFMINLVFFILTLILLYLLENR